MYMCLVDRVVERSAVESWEGLVAAPGATIVTLKHVTMGEEYLQDHFPRFPLLPGVLMMEALVQAARTLVCGGPLASCARFEHRLLVLGRARAVKYGAMMDPGSTLRVSVTFTGINEDASLEFRGEGTRLDSAAAVNTLQTGNEQEVPRAAVSGRFSLRPLVFPTWG